MFLVKRANFNKTYIIKGLITALFLSAFIYLSHFGIENKFLNTILALIGVYKLLKIEKKSLIFAGFFTGILWFYWVGISFEYYDAVYLAPLVVLLFGFTYSILFYLIAFFDYIYFRIFVIFILSFIQPFGFNWFIPELVFIDSFIPTQKVYFSVVLASVFMFIRVNKKLKVLAIIPLLFIYENKQINIDDPKLNISMPQLYIKQDQKWLKTNLANIVENNLKLIQQAVTEKKDLIILPETAFPMYLNKDEFLFEKLLELSMNIDIVTGALLYEDNNFFNATYHFSNGKIKIGKKIVLVPFGEKIPLPKFFVDVINNIFYDGASDYLEAEEPTDFLIKGIKFRNAICYEATTNKIFKNIDNTKYMIAISNNAWFTPSIQPTLQKLLLKHYARKYNITILHSINGSENYMIRP